MIELALISNQELITIEVISLILIFVAIFPILAIVMGYKARWPIILHLLRKRFFIAFFRMPGRQLVKKVYLGKEIKGDKGPIPYIEFGRKNSKGYYWLKDIGFFRHGVDDAIEFAHDNPNPIDVFSNPIAYSGYSSAEERSAFNSKIAEELNRLKINSYEMLMIGLLFVALVGMMITAIYTYQMAHALQTLNNEFSQLYKALYPS